MAQDELRQRNLSTLLRHVHERGPTSRAELTAEMRLKTQQYLTMPSK